MPKSIWSDAPFVDCSSCGHSNYISNYFEIPDGHEIVCKVCGSTLLFTDEECVRRWLWRVVEKED